MCNQDWDEAGSDCLSVSLQIPQLRYGSDERCSCTFSSHDHFAIVCVCVCVESTVSNLSLSPCLMLIICCSPNLLDPDQCVFIGW